MSEIVYRPIGIIHSEHKIQEQTPIQPVFATGCYGSVEIFPEYVEGLTDLEEFSHIYLLFSFHLATAVRLKVKPFLENVERGVFATRAPCRPNGIGLSIVRLLRRENNILHLDGIDILDGTPLLDIKPYTERFDNIKTISNGWQDGIGDEAAKKLGRREYRHKEIS
jgi:tRNA-Thr(GGU) m(6)t(6)A37 methyltransferase TsaA